MSEIFLDYDTRTRKSKYVTIRAFSAARWICLTFLVIQLPVTVCLNWTHESFSLSLDFITDGSLDRYSVFTVDNFENVDEKASKKRRVSCGTRSMNPRQSRNERSYLRIGRWWIVFVSMNRWGQIEDQCAYGHVFTNERNKTW